MRKRVRILSFLAACFWLLFQCALVPAAPGQGGQVVSAEVVLSRSAVLAGESFKLALRLKINPGWHINAHDLNDEFLVASDFTVEEDDRFKVGEYVYPEPTRGRYEYSENELSVYEGEALIGVLAEAAKGLAPGTYKLKGSFAYQACDRRSCLPPQTIPVEVTVELVSDSQLAKDINKEIFEKIGFKGTNR